MKLLVDAHSFDRDVAEGMTTYVKGLYRELTEMAPDVDFYFAANDIKKLKSIFGNAPNIHYVKLKSKRRFRRMLFEYPMLIKKLGIDMAHFQYFSPFLKNCRTVVTLHDVLFKDFPENFPKSYRLTRNIIFGRSARKADIIATVSEYSRERISKHYDIDAKRISVTPNAVDDAFFKADRQNARKIIYARGIRPFILNVSRIEPRKNQLALVRAYVELGLADRGYDLVLINRKALPYGELESYISSLPPKVLRHIHRMDGLPHKDLIDWYAAASLFVFPSLGEGFGIPPLEAGAIGTPVICNNATAMGDFSFFGPNLADLSNVDSLKRLIRKNLDNPPSEEELATIAQEIRKKYSWKTSARILYRQLISKPRH